MNFTVLLDLCPLRFGFISFPLLCYRSCHFLLFSHFSCLSFSRAQKISTVNMWLLRQLDHCSEIMCTILGHDYLLLTSSNWSGSGNCECVCVHNTFVYSLSFCIKGWMHHYIVSESVNVHVPIQYLPHLIGCLRLSSSLPGAVCHLAITHLAEPEKRHPASTIFRFWHWYCFNSQ